MIDGAGGLAYTAEEMPGGWMRQEGAEDPDGPAMCRGPYRSRTDRSPRHGWWRGRRTAWRRGSGMSHISHTRGIHARWTPSGPGRSTGNGSAASARRTNTGILPTVHGCVMHGGQRTQCARSTRRAGCRGGQYRKHRTKAEFRPFRRHPPKRQNLSRLQKLQSPYTKCLQPATTWT